MNTYRNTARMAGALFLIAMVASLAGGAIVNSSLSAPDPFSTVLENESLLLFGVFLEILNALAVVGIAILMFTVIRQENESMAAGYLGFRVIEAVFCSFIVIAPLSVITLSQDFSIPGNPGAVGLDALGALSRVMRSAVVDWLIPVFFSLGALVLYIFLFRSKRLPRFISVWGLISAGLIVVMIVMLFLSFKMSLGMNMAFAMPIILNEIFLGIWLIAKGFNPPTPKM